MKEKILNLFLENQDKLIKKADIQLALQEARKDEAKLQKEINDTEMGRILSALEHDRFMEEESLKADITRLNNVLTNSTLKVKRADDSYYKSIKALKHNRQMTADVLEKLRELMGLLGVLFGSIEDIEKNINTEIKQIEHKR